MADGTMRFRVDYGTRTFNVEYRDAIVTVFNRIGQCARGRYDYKRAEVVDYTSVLPEPVEAHIDRTLRFELSKKKEEP